MKRKMQWVVWLVTLASARGLQADWRQFRGTECNSAVANARCPVEWNTESGKNIAWRVELPGRGPASPIVVGNRVFVTSSSGYRQDRLHVLAYDVDTGQLVWHRQFWATGRTLTHPTSANAAPTPASDGKNVYAFFSSNDLICLGLDGRLRWYRGLAHDYPKTGNDVGMSSSPVVIGETVVVQAENQGDSFAAGIDVHSGETRWRAAREPAANWSSPVSVAGKTLSPGQVILKSNHGLAAHDPQSGRVLWEHKLDAGGIASIAVADGRIYSPGNGLTVLQLDSAAKSPQLVWNSDRLRLGSTSPIVHRDRIYCLNSAGVLNCADIKDGEILWRLRLEGTFWSTPAAAGDHLYCFNDEGVCQVVQLADTAGTIVAKNPLGETIQASPALSGDAIYIRSDQHLWKLDRT